MIRDDKTGQADNVIYNWEVGDEAGTDRAFAQADVISKLELHYPRSHPSPIECCGSVADFNRATSKLTVYMTTQAPHIIRAAVAMVAELPEQMIRIVSPDIGGGFGNKVPIYPGYVCSILASILLERPVKWIEDKTGNLISTGFARDVYLKGEMALRKDGKILGVRMHTDADHGAFFSDAQPSKFKIGLMHSAFAAYDVPVAHLTARGVYTNKAPGGVAYRCSFRVTEAMFFQERMMQAAAERPGHRPGRVPPDELRQGRRLPAPHAASASSPTPGSTPSASTSGSRRSATRTSGKSRQKHASGGACLASASPR